MHGCNTCWSPLRRSHELAVAFPTGRGDGSLPQLLHAWGLEVLSKFQVSPHFAKVVLAQMMDICQCKNNGFPGRKFRRRLARVSSLNGESADLASSTNSKVSPVSPTKPVSEDAKPKNGGSQSSSDSSDSENNDED